MYYFIYKSNRYIKDNLLLGDFINNIYSYYKKNKEIILYLLFGFLTTVVNIVFYIILVWLFGFNYIVGNIFAWLFSVIFAYVTNKLWVFEETENNIILEFTLFIGGRIFSGFVDSLLLYLFVGILLWNDFISKIIIQIIVVLINYIISKWVVFKNKSIT